ncbi:major capsid family protein [Hyphomicrobium sp. CS1GBMeth3]|uniref:DUF2184 domain-containing protein n=1 Tax=Hyphomicrobium sp. CS1GBMeth3 TaxID=1892845 RepID=UPI00092FFDF9|nr:major capsid family protein [Hyphomicrobium sp. CS1GBMeth3]
MKMLDAQAALSFVISQTSHVESQVWKKLYPDITYPEFVPIDESAHPWATTVTYFSADYTGKAAWIHSFAQDFPMVNGNRTKHETEVAMGGIGYGYNLQEISQAAMLGIPLTADLAIASRDAYERHCEEVAYVGDTQKGYSGLLNTSAVDTADVADGASTDPEWNTKTPDEILADINEALLDVYLDSNTIELADTLLLPPSRYSYIATTRLDATMTTTILEHVMRVNAYTAQTGRQLKIRALRQLETAGAGGTKRMVAYRRDPLVLKLHRPMPLRFFPVQQIMLDYKVPAAYRIGGTDIRRPGAVRYRDGI